MAMSLPQLTITVEAFASAADLIGLRRKTLDLPQDCTVARAWSILIKAHPELQQLDATIAFAVNNQLVDRTAILHDGDIVALLPPVSGG